MDPGFAQNNPGITQIHALRVTNTRPARVWNAIWIRFCERYVGDKIVNIGGTAKIIWHTKRGVSPACTPSIRQQYAGTPQYVGVIVLNGFYCSSNYFK